MTFYQQNRLNPTNLNVILTLNIRTFQIRMYSILKTKLMASRKVDLMREAGTNSKTWLLLTLHIWLFHDNLSTDISSTTLRLQTFRLQTFRLLLYTRVQDSYTSNFCFSKSLFSSIPTSTYTMIPFINPTSTDTMIIQHI